MATATALRGFNYLGRSMALPSPPETDCIYNYLHIVQK